MTQPQCPKCGTRVSPGAVVCATCGTGVQAIAEAMAATSMMSHADTPTLHTPPPSGAAPDQSLSATGGLLTQARMMNALKAATLGEYEILAELGRGGMATVYLAHDISLDRKVAIKVMSPALLDGEGAIERFKREAKTAGALSHPHIIPIHAVKQSGELLYFVMKYVEGRPLDDVLKSQGALPITMVAQILTEVAGALAYAHRKGVVHRDIKPANIMLDDEGWAVVTDFGIAKVAEKKGLTLTGSTVGTPAYMSPEQCSATEVTGRSDQYSLGIVGYELLSGKVPFSADSLMGMFLAQMHDAPPPLNEVRPDCPPLLQTVIERMMAKAPEERWPSMEDVVTALAPLLKSGQRESTRISMASLASMTGAKARPEDFQRPVSPVPRNSSRGRPGAAAAAEPVAIPRRVPKWTWAAAGMVPLLVATIWLANKARQPAVTSTPPPAVGDSSVRVTLGNAPPTASPAAPSPGQQAAGNPQPTNTKAASARDSANVTGGKRPAGNPAATTAGTDATPPVTQVRGDTARPQPTNPVTSPAAPPPASPAASARADSVVAPPPDPNAGAPTFIEISAGGSTTCGALANEAGVVCWGAASLTGAKLEGVLFSKLSVGDGHICALTPAGEAFCWGTNSQGQLGDGSTNDRAAPTPVRATQRFAEISVGASHTCALSTDGAAFCWGSNKSGQLGDGSRSNRNRPVLVKSTAGNQGFQSLSAGGAHTCGITRANKAFCWGDGFSGAIGNAMQDYAVEPFAVKTDLSFRAVVAGALHTCGMTTSGRVHCWGDNRQGQLGNDTKDNRDVPDSVSTDQIFRTIAAGAQHTCGITNRRQLYCWGNNVDGRLGDGTRSTRTVPVLSAGGQTFAHVSAGSGHTCALMTDNRAMCFGGNARGQLGGGVTSTYSPTPVVVKVRGG